MKILHTYCLNYNIGDYALGIGLKNLLRYHLDVDLIGDTNIQGREFNEYYIKEVVNKKYDLLVIGGGGILHGSHWPNGWFWLIHKDLIKEIKIPFIIYGIGFNYWEEEGSISLRTIEHLKETIKYARYFSVRNDGSANRLAEQAEIYTPSIPDPGFHINLNSNYERAIKESYIIIQLANDKPNHRFGSTENKQRFVTEMREITKSLSINYLVVFAPHVLDDLSLSYEISKGINNTTVWDFGYFAFDHSDKAIGYYKYADFVIAMRGHGQILPIAFNTPVIAIENHPKHSGLMKELDLLEYSVSLLEANFADRLTQTINKIRIDSNKLSAVYVNLNERLFNETSNAFYQIKKFIL